MGIKSDGMGDRIQEDKAMSRFNIPGNDADRTAEIDRFRDAASELIATLCNGKPIDRKHMNKMTIRQFAAIMFTMGVRATITVELLEKK